MSVGLSAHVLAGALAIGAGAIALSVGKGGRRHRLFGILFSCAMLASAVLGSALALFTPSGGASVPPRASATVGLLTAYLVGTAWMSVRRKGRLVGWPDYTVFALAAGAAAVLLAFGIQSLIRGAPQIPYFVFSVFAAAAALGDYRVIALRGLSGDQRLRRHFWRMCFALFFATAFFFIGQQKVMPDWVRGSPLLFFPAFAPLAALGYWLWRIRRRKA